MSTNVLSVLDMHSINVGAGCHTMSPYDNLLSEAWQLFTVIPGACPCVSQNRTRAVVSKPINIATTTAHRCDTPLVVHDMSSLLARVMPRTPRVTIKYSVCNHPPSPHLWGCMFIRFLRNTRDCCRMVLAQRLWEGSTAAVDDCTRLKQLMMYDG